MYYPTPHIASPLPNFPATNDLGLLEAYEQASASSHKNLGAGDTCAVVVGDAGLLSAAEYMPRTVFVTDRDPLLLEWVARKVGVLLQSSDRAHFLGALQLPGHCRANEQEIFGSKHFLVSEERFVEARQTVGKMAIHYVRMDYGLEGSITTLASTLRRHQVRVGLFNATNMHRYIHTDNTNQPGRLSLEAYMQALTQLPWADPHRIIASQIDLLRVRCLPVQVSVEAYARVASRPPEMMNQHTKKSRLFRRDATPS